MERNKAPKLPLLYELDNSLRLLWAIGKAQALESVFRWVDGEMRRDAQTCWYLLASFFFLIKEINQLYNVVLF